MPKRSLGQSSGLSTKLLRERIRKERRPPPRKPNVRRRREKEEKRKRRPGRQRSLREPEKNVADSARRKNVGSEPGSTTLATLPSPKNRLTTDGVVTRKIVVEEKTLLERSNVRETMFAKLLHRASKISTLNPNHLSTATTSIKLQKLRHIWLGHDPPKAPRVQA